MDHLLSREKRRRGDLFSFECALRAFKAGTLKTE